MGWYLQPPLSPKPRTMARRVCKCTSGTTTAVPGDNFITFINSSLKPPATHPTPARHPARRRYLPSFLVPGPLAYVEASDSFVTCTAALELEAYKYKVIAAASSEKAPGEGCGAGDNDRLFEVVDKVEVWLIGESGWQGKWAPL